MQEIVILVSHFAFQAEYLVSITVAIALVTVIVNAAVIGTFIPILLHKRGIDPAVATGPFITTSNDVLGILIYFFYSEEHFRLLSTAMVWQATIAAVSVRNLVSPNDIG